MEQHRQGDLLFVKDYSDHKDFIQGRMTARASRYRKDPVETQDGKLVLARGEKTGHAHVLDASATESALTLAENEMFIRVTSDVEVTHEEHAPVKLTPGDWSVLLQREHSGRLEAKPREQSRPRFYLD